MNESKFVVAVRWRERKVVLHQSDCYFGQRTGREILKLNLPANIKDIEDAKKWVNRKYKEYEKSFKCPCLKKHSL